MIDTHFTRAFGLLHPFALAPIAPTSDGRLAAAVSRAGGLGLVHVGKLSAGELAGQHSAASGNAVGWGLETKRLESDPDVLGQLLAYRPRAVLLSGGDHRPHADRIKAAGVRLISVVHSVSMAHQAIEVDADVIVAQGNATAGPEPSARSTFALLPEVANAIYTAHSEAQLLACGGITDARGIAASLIMGADGVMMGTRLWASQDAPLPAETLSELLRLTGDDVVHVNASENTTERWHGTGTLAGPQPLSEGVGLIDDAPSIESLLPSLTAKTSRLMTHIRRKVVE